MSQSVIDQILKDNFLYKKVITEGPDSLMRALSDALYFTTIYRFQIQNLCIRFLKSLIDRKMLPTKLKIFQNNQSLFRDYIDNPSFSDFDKINLELVSLLFKVKITVYSVSEELYLQAIIINNSYKKQIQLFYDDEKHYNSLYTLKFMENATQCQQIICEIFNQALQVNFKIQEVYVNFEYEHWFAAKMLNIQEQKSGKGHHKSLSDQFNNSFEVMADLEKKYLDQFSKMIQQEPLMPQPQSQPQPQPQSQSQSQPQPQSQSQQQSQSQSQTQPQPLTQTQTQPQPSIVFQQSSKPKIMDDLASLQQSSNRTHILLVQEIQKLIDMDCDQTDEQKSNDKPQVNEQHQLQSPSKFSPLIMKETKSEKIKVKSPIYYVNQTPPGLKHNVSEGQAYNQDVNVTKFKFDNQDVKNSNNNNNKQKQFQRNQQSSIGSGHNLNQQQKEEKHNRVQVPKKPIILDDSKTRYTGKLKFFDEQKNFGFFVMDIDQSDIFVHCDDLMQASITKEMLKNYKSEKPLRFSFCCMSYIGKHNKSRKATDVKLIDNQ